MESATPSNHSSGLAVWRLMRLIISFALLFFAMNWAYQSARGTTVERFVIDEATVKPSVALINWLSPSEQVKANGSQLISPTTRLSVLNGCEGTESLFLIIAAIMAYRSPWRHKVFGLLVGTALIYFLNQGRIVGLYFALKQNQALFSALHGYIGPTLIIAISCLFFMGWMQWSIRSVSAR